MSITGVGRDNIVRGSFWADTNRVSPSNRNDFRTKLNSSIGTNRSEGMPYGYLAKDGVITYNGVTFVCDYDKNAICLGDMSDRSKVLSIPLSKGGSLMVNRDNIGELSKAIGMFSPEDVNRILRAIALDAQCQRKLQEIEEAENDSGSVKGAEEAAESETESKESEEDKM